MEFPRSPIPQDNLTSWLSRFHSAVERLPIAESDTIAVRTTDKGTVLEVKDHVIANIRGGMTFEENYIDGNAYRIGAVTVLTSSATWSGSFGSLTAQAGPYVNISPVPPRVSMSLFTGDQNGAYLTSYFSSSCQDPTICYAPVYPYSSSVPAYQTANGRGQYWVYLGGVSSGGVQRFKVNPALMSGDYYGCVTWDGSTTGSSTVYVAKPYTLRHSIASEVIDGLTISYNYVSKPSNIDGARSASCSGYSSQLEMVVPIWYSGSTYSQWSEIYATQPQGGTGVGSAPSWLDINVDGRAWCQYL